MGLFYISDDIYKGLGAEHNTVFAQKHVENCSTNSRRTDPEKDHLSAQGWERHVDVYFLTAGHPSVYCDGC